MGHIFRKVQIGKTALINIFSNGILFSCSSLGRKKTNAILFILRYLPWTSSQYVAFNEVIEMRILGRLGDSFS